MRGSALLVLILLFFLLWHSSRWSQPERVETPALLYFKPGQMTIALSEAGIPVGVHQLNDAAQVIDVIKLTSREISPEAALTAASAASLESGELFKISLLDGTVVGFQRSWMPASHRMLLGIPLHPDRMTSNDWESLPGIGPKLAAAIEADRQKNGDFLQLEALDRVKGVGPKKLEQWQRFFNPLPGPVK